MPADVRTFLRRSRSRPSFSPPSAQPPSNFPYPGREPMNETDRSSGASPPEHLPDKGGSSFSPPGAKRRRVVRTESQLHRGVPVEYLRTKHFFTTQMVSCDAALAPASRTLRFTEFHRNLNDSGGFGRPPALVRPSALGPRHARRGHPFFPNQFQTTNTEDMPPNRLN